MIWRLWEMRWGIVGGGHWGGGSRWLGTMGVKATGCDVCGGHIVARAFLGCCFYGMGMLSWGIGMAGSSYDEEVLYGCCCGER